MSFNRIALRRGAQWLLCAGALVTELIAASQNNIKGTVVGQELGQPKTTLPGVSVQAFEAAGTEVASRHTDNNGAFTFGLDPKSRVYRLILWDERNRWWGREIADLPNDSPSTTLPPILLRPQTSALSKAEEREENAVIVWLRKHNPLSAAVMELHLGTFDRPGTTGGDKDCGCVGRRLLSPLFGLVSDLSTRSSRCRRKFSGGW